MEYITRSSHAEIRESILFLFFEFTNYLIYKFQDTGVSQLLVTLIFLLQILNKYQTKLCSNRIAAVSIIWRVQNVQETFIKRHSVK